MYRTRHNGQEEYEENKNKQKGEWKNLTGVKLL